MPPRPLAAALVAALLGALIGITPAARACAAEAPTPALSAEDKALVKKAADYLQALKGIEGKFVQIDPKGQRSTGLFYVQRPGKARFQYDPPAQLLVVADGADVSVYDRKLKSFDQYPLAQTPLALLLSDSMRLDQAVAILGVERTKDGFSITAGDAHRRTPGRLSLRFSQNPVALRGWTLVDAQGQKTDVSLTSVATNAHLPPNLFILRDPHGEKGVNVAN